MNRSLVLFLTFVGLLAAVMVAVALWLGPVAWLALDSDTREAPYFVIALHKSEGSESLDELVRGEDAQVLFAGTLDHMLGGLVRRDEWRSISVYRFARGADFINLLTGSAYRSARRDIPSGGRLLLGTNDAPVVLDQPAWALWLVRQKSAQILEAHSALLTTSVGYGGVSAWDGDLVNVEGEGPWASLRVVAFPNVKQAFAWHQDPETQTEVALMQARYADSAGLLYVSP